MITDRVAEAEIRVLLARVHVEWQYGEPLDDVLDQEIARLSPRALRMLVALGLAAVVEAAGSSGGD